MIVRSSIIVLASTLVAINVGLYFYGNSRPTSANITAEEVASFTPFRRPPAAAPSPQKEAVARSLPPAAKGSMLLQETAEEVGAKRFSTAGATKDVKLAFATNEASQYLFHVVVDGRPQGFFVLQVEGPVVHVSQDLRRSLALPEGVKTLEDLSTYGELDVDLPRQRINFIPDYRLPESQPATLTPANLMADISSVDLVGSAAHSPGGRRYFGSAWVSGALGPADLDLRLRSDDDARFSGSFRFNNSAVREVEIGDIQRQKLKDAVRVSNRAGADRQLDEAVDLFFPQGSKVDVFLNGEFLETFVSKSEPETYRFDLRSGRQRYEFVATTEDGAVLREEVDRSLFVDLSPGTIFYDFASGRGLSGDRSYSLSTEIGITSGANAFFDYQDERWSAGLRLGSEHADLSFAKTSAGFSTSGSLRSDFGYLAAQRTQTETLAATRFSAGVTELVGQPRYSFRHTRTAFNTAREHTFSAGFRGRSAGLSWYLTPRYRHRGNSDYPDQQTFDVQGLAALGRSTLRAQISHSRNADGLQRQRARASIDQRFSWGRASYTSSINCSSGCSEPLHSISLSAPTDHFTFTGVASFIGGRSHALQLSVSTSLTRNGVSTSVRQAPYAVATINACLDEDGNGHCDGGAVQNVDVIIRGQKKRTPVHQAQLDPDLPGQITAIPPPGFMMTGKTRFSIASLRRGAVNYLTVPVVPIRTVEGVIPSARDGVLVTVLVDGQVAASQRTSFDGWYSFELPAPDAKVAILKTESGDVL